MRRYLLIMLLLVFPAIASAKSETVVYVCAHPDDCFLFMNPNLYDDIVDASNKVVVVYLTSGDAGFAFSTEGDATAYPNARELASIDATQWMADVGKDPIQAHLEKETTTIAGHVIPRIGYANTVSYFLRLPDGNMYGDGFERYHHESLRKLKSGEIERITPIDDGAPYAGWQDLVQVLSGILTREAEGESHMTLHIAEPDIAENIHDHSDHTTGASGVMDALAQMTADARETPARCYQLYKHIDYSIAEKQTNLEGVGLQNKSGSFAVLTATQRHFLDHHNWDEGHLSYLTRNYYTITTLPEGCATQRP